MLYFDSGEYLFAQLHQVAMATQYLTTFIVGVIIAFCYNWKLTLVIIAMFPVRALSSIDLATPTGLSPLSW